MKTVNSEDIKRIFKILKHCSLTHKQEDIVESLEEWFTTNGSLTPKQQTLLLDIYEKADA